MTHYIAAIDQGTTGTRCILFTHDGNPLTGPMQNTANLP